MSDLMTVSEVAEYFRTTTTTVYRWLKQGKLKSVKIGKEWRIFRSSLDANQVFPNTEIAESSKSVWGELNQNEHLL
ncbi:MAG TPA: excisionase, partial [Eubacteriaceae bacterium]|nr:excisionase [Eubacteriaceae bacterium]